MFALAAVLAVPAAAQAAFPGDNGRIAFTHGYTNVVTILPDGSDPIDLTPAVNDHEPAWSPDGTKIAFASSAYGDSRQQIYTMNADGSDRGRVTFSGLAEANPAWSPDGRKLVFERVVDDSTCDGFLYCGTELFTVDVDGTNERRLTDNQTFDMQPAWSPDGTKIAFSRYERGTCGGESYDCQWDIFTITPEGDGEARLTHNDEANRWPNWSPDGSQIALSSTQNACCVGEIFKMDEDGGELTQLTFFSYSRGDWFTSTEPAWSPDGTKIAFAAGYGGLNHEEIQVIDADGRNVKRLTDAPGVKFGPDWQPLGRDPDCSSVAVSRPVLTTANRRLVTVTLDGGTDPDGDPLSFAIDAVTQDEPVESTGDPTSPDAVDDGDGQVRIRAERNPHGDGRVYRISFTASDGRGGVCQGAVTVSVPRKKHRPAVDSAPPSYDSLAR